MTQGPSVTALTHRLAAIPADFLAPAAMGQSGRVAVVAVVGDLLRELHGREPAMAILESLAAGGDESRRNWQQLLLIASWLLRDPWFVAHPPPASAVTGWLQSGVRELADMVKAERFVQLEEHREELARLCLKTMGLLPEGESANQAQDRLETVSTLERQRVKAAAQRAREESRKRREALEKQQQEKARLAREEMEKRAAESGASKVSRD